MLANLIGTVAKPYSELCLYRFSLPQHRDLCQKGEVVLCLRGKKKKRRVQQGSDLWANYPKAYKASSNLLKEIIKLSQEKYK